MKLNQQNKTGTGLQCSTSNKLLTRLPVLLVQIKARNNSEKLKNKIRQIMYKKITKKNYKKVQPSHYNNGRKYGCNKKT